MAKQSIGQKLLELWEQLAGEEDRSGRFGDAIAGLVPYTGSLGARVESLAPGSSVVSLQERREIQNHLNSIHAVALTNLGEFASGLAVLTALPADVEGIVVRLETDYRKKARGTVRATCDADLPTIGLEETLVATANIRDSADEIVAVVRAGWRLRRPGK